MAIATPRTPAFRFALLGLVWGLSFYGFVRLPWIESHAVLPITRLQGRAATLLSGMPVLPVDVTLACSGMDLLALCFGAVLAYPTRWRARVSGAAIGLVLILTLNTLRIATLGVAAASPQAFAALHFYVWPAILVIAVAGYVLWWMRSADSRATLAAPRVFRGRPHLRFLFLLAACAVIFAAASALYSASPWVLAATEAVALATTFVLSGAGMTVSAAGNILTTPRGRFQVTDACILTPLIPLYVAGAIAYAGGWRRVVLFLAVAPLVFFSLAVARLLVVVLPAATGGTTLFLIHAFSQLLMACLLVCAVAWWRHRSGPQLWTRAPLALAAGALLLYALEAAGSHRLVAPGVADAQGALGMLPSFQLAFAAALWIAWGAPAGWRVFAIGIAALALSQAAILAAVDAVRVIPGVPAVRAWALAGPLLLFVLMGRHDRARA